MGMATTGSEFHVLAVDDSIIDRKLIERLLRTSSYQVTTVDSGSKALKFLGLNEDDQTNPNSPSVSPLNHQEVEVNLIITDYCMPGMTGYDLLKKIKESSSLKNIPVVIMSSENVPSRITRCMEEGAEEFFLKPVKLADLHKLKTHMMRTKNKNEQECKQNEIPLTKKLEPEEGEKQNLDKAETEKESQQQPQLTQPSNSNKRKNIEEGLSPDGARPRYNDITTVV